MTRDKNKFFKLELKSSGFVTFGDNSKGKIIGKGEVGKELSQIIKNVCLLMV